MIGWCLIPGKQALVALKMPSKNSEAAGQRVIGNQRLVSGSNTGVFEFPFFMRSSSDSFRSEMLSKKKPILDRYDLLIKITRLDQNDKLKHLRP